MCDESREKNRPGSWLLAPGSWLLAPGSWLLAHFSIVLIFAIAPLSQVLAVSSDRQHFFAENSEAQLEALAKTLLESGVSEVKVTELLFDENVSNEERKALLKQLLVEFPGLYYSLIELSDEYFVADKKIDCSEGEKWKKSCGGLGYPPYIYYQWCKEECEKDDTYKDKKDKTTPEPEPEPEPEPKPTPEPEPEPEPKPTPEPEPEPEPEPAPQHDPEPRSEPEPAAPEPRDDFSEPGVRSPGGGGGGGDSFWDFNWW